MMTTSANTSRAMKLNLEKRCADLEGQLSIKNKALDSAEEKLWTEEENMALVIIEKDK